MHTYLIDLYKIPNIESHYLFYALVLAVLAKLVYIAGKVIYWVLMRKRRRLERKEICSRITQNEAATISSLSHTVKEMIDTNREIVKVNEALQEDCEKLKEHVENCDEQLGIFKVKIEMLHKNSAETLKISKEIMDNVQIYLDKIKDAEDKKEQEE